MQGVAANILELRVTQNIIKLLSKYTNQRRGTWVAQAVKHLTLDFSSGHDPHVVGSSPTSGSVLSMEPA